jgi:hypothetical protein
MHGRAEHGYKILGGKPHGRRILGSLNIRW